MVAKHVWAPNAVVTPVLDEATVVEATWPRAKLSAGAFNSVKHKSSPQPLVVPQLDGPLAIEQSWPKPQTIVGATWIGAPRLIWTLNHNGQVFTFRVPVHNFLATRAPTATDDRTAGYTPGSMWCGRTIGGWMLLDNTQGAAAWGQFLSGAT